jgi:peptidoglycan/xylan/chitin deacetylase (PgdA/CDA1 family)
MLGLGAAAAIAGCTVTGAAPLTQQPDPAGPTAPAVPPTTTAGDMTAFAFPTDVPDPVTSLPTTTTTAPPPPPPPTLPPIPPARPGPPVVVSQALTNTSQIAITIDDGFCEECVAGYVDFAERTGVKLTFSPNGTYSDIWNRYASRLRPLIAAGQVQMGNHTWSHANVLNLSDAAIRAEIQRNEDWLQTVFGVTGRPWFRPPYGYRNARTDAAAASIGYTRIVMWNATLGDATLETPEVLMGLASRWIKAGAILLGHANYPTVIHLFDQLQALIASRGLQPVTLDTMFGTSRATG